MDILDDLTQLHHRRSCMGLLSRHISMTNEKQTLLGLIVVDIDRFAQINGASGYGFGDKVLCHLAKQIKAVGRTQDHAARIGDNRFALILPRLLNRGHAELAVQKLLRLLEVPIDAGNGAKLMLSVTAGVALCPIHATHGEYLLRKAELALATARIEGQRFGFAPDAQPSLSLSEMWDLELELAGAIERGEMRMYYQPQVRISDNRPVGVEALMRWNSRSRGMVSPDIFIPLATGAGHIKRLTLWAMNTVLRQAAQWQHRWGSLSVAVNMPSEMVSQRDLPEIVQSALHLWGQDNVGLMLEITERSLMDREQAMDKLQRIRQLGVTISIDDFGTGYSCLAYFKNIPADELKIDKSFVSGLLDDTASADITTLIIDLAHRFGLAVVAEGVEDIETLHDLKARGCDIAQGYLIGKPMSSDDLQVWLENYEPSQIA